MSPRAAPAAAAGCGAGTLPRLALCWQCRSEPGSHPATLQVGARGPARGGGDYSGGCLLLCNGAEAPSVVIRSSPQAAKKVIQYACSIAELLCDPLDPAQCPLGPPQVMYELLTWQLPWSGAPPLRVRPLAREQGCLGAAAVQQLLLAMHLWRRCGARLTTPCAEKPACPAPPPDCSRGAPGPAPGRASAGPAAHGRCSGL